MKKREKLEYPTIEFTTIMNVNGGSSGCDAPQFEGQDGEHADLDAKCETLESPSWGD